MFHSSTLVLLSNGSYKSISEITIDDILMNPDGEPVSISYIKSSEVELYRITCTYGHSFLATKDSFDKTFTTSEIELPHKNVTIDVSDIEYFLTSNNCITQPTIPKNYLINSRKVREEVLNRLLSCMCKYKTYHEVEIFHNYQLVKDLQYLCSSLGIITMLRRRPQAQVSSHTLRIFIIPKLYIGTITSKEEINKDLIRYRTRNCNKVKIAGLYRCYQIEVASGTYLLENFIRLS